MKNYGHISDPKDIITKEYLEGHAVRGGVAGTTQVLTVDENGNLVIPIATGDIGLVKGSSYYGIYVNNLGDLVHYVISYSDYLNKTNNYAIGKGTLENVFTARNLTTAEIDQLWEEAEDEITIS